MHNYRGRRRDREKKQPGKMDPSHTIKFLENVSKDFGVRHVSNGYNDWGRAKCQELPYVGSLAQKLGSVSQGHLRELNYMWGSQVSKCVHMEF